MEATSACWFRPALLSEMVVIPEPSASRLFYQGRYGPSMQPTPAQLVNESMGRLGVYDQDFD